MPDNFHYGINSTTDEDVTFNRPAHLTSALYAGMPGSGIRYVVHHEIAQIVKKAPADDIIYAGLEEDKHLLGMGFKTYMIDPKSDEPVNTINPLDIVVDPTKRDAELCHQDPGFIRGYEVCEWIAQIFMGRPLINSERGELIGAYYLVMGSFLEKCYEKFAFYDPENNPTFLDVLRAVSDGDFKSRLIRVTHTSKCPDGTLKNTVLDQKTTVAHEGKTHLYPSKNVSCLEYVILQMVSYVLNRTYINDQRRHKTWSYIEYGADGSWYQMLSEHLRLAHKSFGVTSYIFAEGFPENKDTDLLQIVDDSGLGAFTRLTREDEDWLKDVYWNMHIDTRPLDEAPGYDGFVVVENPEKCYKMIPVDYCFERKDVEHG